MGQVFEWANGVKSNVWLEDCVNVKNCCYFNNERQRYGQFSQPLNGEPSSVCQPKMLAQDIKHKKKNKATKKNDKAKKKFLKATKKSITDNNKIFTKIVKTKHPNPQRH